MEEQNRINLQFSRENVFKKWGDSYVTYGSGYVTTIGDTGLRFGLSQNGCLKQGYMGMYSGEWGTSYSALLVDENNKQIHNLNDGIAINYYDSRDRGRLWTEKFCSEDAYFLDGKVHMKKIRNMSETGENKNLEMIVDLSKYL